MTETVAGRGLQRAAAATLAAPSESLADFFRHHPERRYIMFGGKGGLGASPTSSRPTSSARAR